MKELGIFGCSGFSREVADIAIELGYRPIHVVRDTNDVEEDGLINDFLSERELERYRKLPFAIGIGDNAVRRKIATTYSGQLNFINLVHPSATFGKSQREQLESRTGNVICAGVRITNGVGFGDFVIVNLNATIGHDVAVEDFVNIAPGANISGNVTLGSGCWIGTGAAVIQGTGERKLRVGAYTVVGAGAVVISDCEPSGVYVGSPARRIK